MVLLKCQASGQVLTHGCTVALFTPRKIKHIPPAVPCSVGEECTEQVPSIVEACMQTDVALRPSAKDLVGMLQVPVLNSLVTTSWRT